MFFQEWQNLSRHVFGSVDLESSATDSPASDCLAELCQYHRVLMSHSQVWRYRLLLWLDRVSKRSFRVNEAGEIVS